MVNLQNKAKRIITYAYTVFLLLINSVRIFNDSIWGDEGFSIRLAKSSMNYIIERTARDVHPPLYYFILKFFYILFGPSAMAGKFVSFLAVLLVCIIAITYFYEKFGASVAMIIVGVVTFTGNCVPMIVEIRMYTWAMFFVFANLVCINELLEKFNFPRQLKYWTGLCIFSLMAAYTHYYALVIVAIMDAITFVLLFLKEKGTWKKSIISMACMVVGYLPWLFILLDSFRNVSQDYWIKNIDVKGYIGYVFGADIWGYMLMCVLVISVLGFYFTRGGIFDHENGKNVFDSINIKWGIGTGLRKKDKQLVFICLAASFGTLFVGILVSLIFRPIYMDRYIFPAICLVATALAISYVKTYNNRILIVLLLLLMGISGVNSFRNIYNLESTYLTEETKGYIADNLKEEDIFLTDNEMLSWTVMEYYFPDNTVFSSKVYEIEQLETERIWLLLETDETILQKAENAGYEVEKVMDAGFDMVFFTLYLLHN